MTNDSRTQQS